MKKGNSSSRAELLTLEIEAALLKEKVYDIGAIGWLNADNPDPDLIGHAMWQLDQPSIDFNALWGEHPVHDRPEDLEKEILTAGEDYCGVMQACRLSIGLALIWYQQAYETPFNQDSFFWMHHTDAFLKLEIASDRLRKVLIVACTGASSKKFKNRPEARDRKDWNWFVTPFHLAKELLNERHLTDPRFAEALDRIPALSEEVFKFIDRRNKIVHEVATRMAMSSENGLREMQQLHDKQKNSDFTKPVYDFKEWDKLGHAREKKIQDDVKSRKDELSRWYHLLEDLGNYVFQIEYWSRVLSRSSHRHPS